MAKQQETVVNSRGERKILRQIIHLIFVNNFFYVLGFVVIFLGYAVLVDTEYEPLVPKEEKSEFVSYI